MKLIVTILCLLIVTAFFSSLFIKLTNELKKSIKSTEENNEPKRPQWVWRVILGILVAILFGGGYAVANGDYPFILGVAAFSIAFGIHYFAVSISLNNIHILQYEKGRSGESKKIRKIEYDIVTSGLYVLCGGLLLILTAGIGYIYKKNNCLLICDLCSDFKYLSYVCGSVLLSYGVARYSFLQRRWPAFVKKVLKPDSDININEMQPKSLRNIFRCDWVVLLDKDTSMKYNINVPLAVIGGSQAYDLLQRGSIRGERIGEIETPFGHSQPVYHIHDATGDMLFLSRHGEKGYNLTAPFVNYRANIYALKELGVKQIVSWSGPGAINTSYQIGEYVIVDDIVDETHGRESTFYKNSGIGFIRQSPVFCPTLRECIISSLKNLHAGFSDKGTYVCTQGPRLETPAEIKKYKSYGCDLVGMTLVPEVFLAKELEMCYAAICYVTNYAEGVVDRPFKAGELFEGLSDDADRKAVEKAVSNFPAIISEIAKNIKQQKPFCQCPSLMERYKRRGDIGPDWHDWITKI